MLTQNHLTREQGRVNEFLQQSQPLRDLAAQVTGTGLKQLTGNTVEALSFFIESELHYRQAERYQALKLHADRAKDDAATGDQANERGLQSLQKASAAFSTMRSDVQNLDPAKTKRELLDYRDQLRDAIAHAELKTKDIQRLDQLFEECFQTVQSKGVAGLADHMQNAAKQLDGHRRQPDRGVIDNFPLWKVGGLIVLLGVGIIALIHCGIFGCSIDTRNAYLAALITVALITLGC
jgi:hypothetical protein